VTQRNTEFHVGLLTVGLVKSHLWKSYFTVRLCRYHWSYRNASCLSKGWASCMTDTTLVFRRSAYGMSRPSVRLSVVCRLW